MNPDQPRAVKGNILIVDDALDNLNLLYATLTQHGYEVRKAISGAMALMGVQAAPPDLILLDIKMPDMLGYEVCQHLKAMEQTREIPVIFLSALDETFNKVQAFAVGGVDYITKPFQAAEVIARIENQLALQTAKAEIRQLNTDLEQRVQQRTVELEVANQELRREVTERKRVEEALCQSEERFRVALKNSPVTIFNQDTELRYTWVYNPVLGCDPETILGKRDIDFLPFDEARRFTAIKQQVLTTGQGRREEISFRLGEKIWHYDLTIEPLPGPLGEIMGITCAATDITQVKRVEAQLRQQVEQEQLVTGIAQRIRQSLDLNAILSTTVAEVRQFLQVDRALIFRFQPDWSGVVVVESVVEPQFSILGKTIKDHCFSESYVTLYQEGRVHTIDNLDTATLSPCHTELLASFQVKANLVVPIVQEKALWGLLIAHHCTQPRQWHTLEIDLLKQLSTQLAIAIQQSELYRQVQQFNIGLEHQVQERTLQLQQSLNFEAALKRITDKVRDSLDESQILQAAVRELAHVLQVECCDAGIYSPDLTTSTIGFEHTFSLPSCQGSVIQVSDYEEVYQHLLQSRSIQLCYSQPGQVRQLNHQFTVLACPVFDDQGVIGDLWLFKPAAAIFEDLEVRLVQQIANQCAIALRQARLYAAVQNQVKTLEHLHQLKDDFLSTVSHELRSPVTNMKMAIQMLVVAFNHIKAIDLEGGERTNPLSHQMTQRISQYLQILDSECEREISLVNDLLDLQRLEAEAQPLIRELIDLNHLLSVVVDAFQERIHFRQQNLQVAIPESLPLIISNPDALSRVLTELLHNACKYTPPGERIVVEVLMKPGKTQLQVTNFGAEIPSSELPYIFEKFYRVISTDRWQQGGTGLGLALVRKLVEHLGGNIQASSTQGQTTFTVEIPLQPADLVTAC